MRCKSSIHHKFVLIDHDHVFTVTIKTIYNTLTEKKVKHTRSSGG